MMNIFELYKIKRFFAIAISLTIAFFLFSQPIVACSWDYPIWQVRSKNADPLYRFIKNGKAGYIDQTGKIVIAPKLDFYGNYGGEFFDGLLMTGIGDGDYIDKTGKVVLDVKYSSNSDFSEGLAAAKEEGSNNWGYIDKTGKFAITPRFEDSGYLFSGGRALLAVKKRYGYIDRTGEIVIQPKFLKGDDFNEGFARVIVEGPCVYVSEGGCAMFNAETVGGEDKNQKAPMCKFAFIDKTGTLISNDRFERAGPFSEGLAAVKLDGKWGYIDTKGEMVIKPQFGGTNESFSQSGAIAFSEGLAAVKQGELWGFVNKKGEIVIAPQFDLVESFSDGLALVGKWNEQKSEYGEYYYIDKDGKQAFPDKFAVASSYFKGIAHVKLIDPKQKDDDSSSIVKYAYIDVKGRKIFTYKYKNDDD